MERQENAMVAPATLFMGLTVAAVIGGAIYFFTRDKDEDVVAGGNGDDTPDNGDDGVTPLPQFPGTVPSNEWNTTLGATNVVSVQRGRTYNTVVKVPTNLTDPNFDVNVGGGVEVKSVGAPQLSTVPNVSDIAVSFVAEGNGSIELVWPKGSTPGQDILTQFRRLNIMIGAVA